VRGRIFLQAEAAEDGREIGNVNVHENSEMDQCGPG
jgi:hypothetical protein